MFSDADSNDVVTRRVAENTGPGGNVGDPVTATGPDNLEYSLAGTDAKYFNIGSASGQITVGGDDPATTGDSEEGEDPMLNFEASKNTYSVTVKAADGQSAEVTVNIVVTDVNEPPAVTDEDADEEDNASRHRFYGAEELR